MSESEKSFRPLAVAKILNICITTVLIAVAVFIYLKFSVPIWVCGFLMFAAMFWGIHTVVLFFAKVTFGKEGICKQGFRRRNFKWNDILCWSDHGAENPVYFKTIDGKVHGFDGWCVFGSRRREVASLMFEFLGDPVVGASAVLPAFLSFASENYNPGGLIKETHQTSSGTGKRGQDSITSPEEEIGGR